MVAKSLDNLDAEPLDGECQDVGHFLTLLLAVWTETDQA